MSLYPITEIINSKLSLVLMSMENLPFSSELVPNAVSFIWILALGMGSLFLESRIIPSSVLPWISETPRVIHNAVILINNYRNIICRCVVSMTFMHKLKFKASGTRAHSNHVNCHTVLFMIMVVIMIITIFFMIFCFYLCNALVVFRNWKSTFVVLVSFFFMLNLFSIMVKKMNWKF